MKNIRNLEWKHTVIKTNEKHKNFWNNDQWMITAMWTLNANSDCGKFFKVCLAIVQHYAWQGNLVWENLQIIDYLEVIFPESMFKFNP